MTDNQQSDDGNTERIRALNDRLRTEGTGGRIYATSGVQALGAARVEEVLREVRSFDNFIRDNDPYGEHDFGSLSIDDQTIFFKIDYYDLTGTKGSEDPADPAKTLRVLTIMLAEEY